MLRFGLLNYSIFFPDTGLLLRQLSDDIYLHQYDVIVLDEVSFIVLFFFFSENSLCREYNVSSLSCIKLPYSVSIETRGVTPVSSPFLICVQTRLFGQLFKAHSVMWE